MRILQVTHRYPPQVGGVETHVKEISERLADRGHEVTVFSADAGMEGERREVRNGVTIRRFHSFAPSGAFYLAPGIVPAVRRADVDVVHAHNYHALPALAAAVGVREARFVFTTHYHRVSPDGFRDRLLSLYLPLGHRALQHADSVIAVSEWERDRLHNDFGVDVTIIPNGLDIERFANADPEERDRPYLLCVGRLEEYKGIQYVIRSLPHFPRHDLIVVGRGPFRGYLEHIAQQAGVADRVFFLGFVDEAQLPSLYKGAEVFVSLSEFEAFGLTVGEALAAGTPCVVYDRSALGDWTSMQGCIGVDTCDSEKLAVAIECARGRWPDLKELWSWEKVVDRLMGIYRLIPNFD